MEDDLVAIHEKVALGRQGTHKMIIYTIKMFHQKR